MNKVEKAINDNLNQLNVLEDKRILIEDDRESHNQSPAVIIEVINESNVLQNKGELSCNPQDIELDISIEPISTIEFTDVIKQKPLGPLKEKVRRSKLKGRKAFERGLDPERILGITESPDAEEMQFLIKWKGDSEVSLNIHNSYPYE